jgi:hypothetical protein
MGMQQKKVRFKKRVGLEKYVTISMHMVSSSMHAVSAQLKIRNDAFFTHLWYNYSDKHYGTP